MQATETIDSQLPWYRQFWPWFIISIPLATVIAGIATIILAINSPNSMVVDNYYKEGLAINEEKLRFQNAADLGIEGLLRTTASEMILQLSSQQPENEEQLELRLVHATRADLDRTITLLHDNGNTYRADFTGLLAGSWYLHLQPPGKDWEIREKVSVSGPFQARLTAD
ncbi:MAG: FixH family protein [Gammaproteobacteria bacterium]